MDKFQNKYRISSARLKNWDYGSPGLYFETVCTRDREHYFGEIIQDEMILNDLGAFVQSESVKTPEIRRDMNLELGEFVVMPNHFHGIMIIGENEFNKRDDIAAVDNVETPCMASLPRNTPPDTKSPPDAQSPNESQFVSANKFGPQSKSLGSIMRGFKSSVTTHSKIVNVEFGWQARFYDHIIRNQDELIRISNYILNNPQN